ncbi:glutathione S-transferase family protein [Musicola paradisiaca]|uniref:Glutathione S-transferase domain protein n=1 Tax=Musicola paradisiaca (strain Ech703) TaxID=579405 RepID=C6C8B8_MUSP7|nr:glutathione S-transferase [Musicola paradisiaca]ACS86084.1 Glutathione S-transferase domain protein [Musicola paradisiaca Ech703]
MLKVWGRDNSTNVKKVRWCAAELNVPYEWIPAGGQFGRNRDADYLALNPNGLVPCLQDDDLVLWESNAIVRYLAAQYGAGTLWLADPKARAAAEKWMDWAIGFSESFRQVFINLIRTAPEHRDLQAVANGQANCEKLLSVADAALAGQNWLSGDNFGIGDIPLGCFAYAWFNMPIARQSHPHLERWYQQLTERPAFQQTVMLPLS